MRKCKQGFEINETTGRCVKVCKTGSSRNPATGRCKMTKKVKECKEGREVNPLTGRCVKVCKKGSERSPTTGKCAKKTQGKSKKPVPVIPSPVPVTPSPVPVTPSPVPVTPSPVHNTRARIRIKYSPDESDIEDRLCSITDDELKGFLESEIFKAEIDGRDSFYQQITRDSRREGLDNCEYVKTLFPPTFVNRISSILGSGVYGAVFSNIDEDGKTTAIKIEPSKGPLQRKEIRLHDKLYKLGISAQVIEHATFHVEDSGFRTHSFLKMQKVDGILADILFTKEWSDDELYEIVLRLFEMIKIMSDNKVSHNDMHFYNIGYVIDDSGSLELKLLDLGQSREVNRPMVDILKVIMFNYSFTDNADNNMREKIDRYARDFSKSMFGFEFPEFEGDEDRYTNEILRAMATAEMERRI